MGEVAVAAVATARAGGPADEAFGVMLGWADGSARVAPPRATCVLGLADGVASDGCVLVALALLGDDWRETAVAAGPGESSLAVRGPVLACTSLTLVTTLATAGVVLRVVLAVAFGDWLTTGESAEESAEARRTGVAEFEGFVALEATSLGRGCPVAVAACAAVSVCRRVAVLVGESSPGVADVVAAAGAA